MFITVLLSLLSERSYNVSKRTQAFIDVPSLFESLCVSHIGEADVKSFATRPDQTNLKRLHISPMYLQFRLHTANPEWKNRVWARRSFKFV